MIGKFVKTALLGAAGLALVGGAIFGRDLYSYVASSTRLLQTSVKGNPH